MILRFSAIIVPKTSLTPTENFNSIEVLRN